MNRIIRAKTTKGFTIIPNGVFTAGLSLRSIGLLTYILHLPDDWVLYKTHLYATMPKDGRDAIKTAWSELEEAGYIKTEKTGGGGKGKLPEITYIVYDCPAKVVGNPSVENPQPKIPSPNKRQRKKGSLLRTNKHSTIEQSTIEPITETLTPGGVSPDPVVSNEPQEVTPPGCASPPQDEKVKTMYPRFIDIYDKWFKGFHDGVPPNYANGNGNAAKSLILYFKKIAGERAKKDGIVLDEAGLEAKALDGWQYVLVSWPKLDNFLQAKTRLVDINSNIQNIITQIKNGHGKGVTNNNGKRATGGDVSVDDIAGKVAAFAAANGGK